MLFMYPAYFHKESDGYWLEFPDLPGVYSQGDDFAETYKNAQEALELYLSSAVADGDDLVRGSDISTVKPIEYGLVNVVSVDFDPYKNANRSVKKTLSVPAWLNDKALAMGLNFSKVLQEALLERITR